MEKVENIAKYILSLDKNNSVFINNLIILNDRKCYEGNVRLNKYLHIMQMTYMAMNEKKLFDEPMHAYDNGIVVEAVMNNYSMLNRTKNSYKIDSLEIKEFIDKLYKVLEDAPLSDLIEISHQDNEWKSKHNYFHKENQKIDVDKQLSEYKRMCADFIYLINK